MSSSKATEKVNRCQQSVERGILVVVFIIFLLSIFTIRWWGFCCRDHKLEWRKWLSYKYNFLKIIYKKLFPLKIWHPILFVIAGLIIYNIFRDCKTTPFRLMWLMMMRSVDKNSTQWNVKESAWRARGCTSSVGGVSSCFSTGFLRVTRAEIARLSASKWNQSLSMGFKEV